MSNDIQYIGVFDEPISEPSPKKIKKDEPKFKTNKRNKKISKFISSTKKPLISKKMVIIILIVLVIFWLKPLTFLKAKLNEKKEYYSNYEPQSYSLDHFFENVTYASGYEYYKNCSKSMVYPADGLITCQYDFHHQGIDIACEEYQGNIYAAANGHVCYIGYSEKYGNEILIEHEINGYTLYTYYANLSQIYVTNGQYVYQNQVIALEGGNPEKNKIMDSNGHYLHFEVRKAKKSGTGLNPLIFLQ